MRVFVFRIKMHIKVDFKDDILCREHTPIDRFLAPGKINTLAFVHFSLPLVALIMEFSAVAVMLCTLPVEWKEK